MCKHIIEFLFFSFLIFIYIQSKLYSKIKKLLVQCYKLSLGDQQTHKMINPFKFLQVIQKNCTASLWGHIHTRAPIVKNDRTRTAQSNLNLDHNFVFLQLNEHY